jgi:methylated-DNA-protein-cysteine methyltransferase-like protein
MSQMFDEMKAVIRKIPRGRVATYGAVAKAAGFPGASRQVAWALRGTDGRLPWHRVLGSGGKILLPGSSGADQKLRLQAEGIAFRGAKVRMDLHEFKFKRK